jgi:dTMP kinase
VVLLLDCPPDAAADRRSRELDRLESEADSFHDRIRQTFLEMAADDPDRWVVIDAAQSIADVSAAVWAAVEARLEREDRP